MITLSGSGDLDSRGKWIQWTAEAQLHLDPVLQSKVRWYGRKKWWSKYYFIHFFRRTGWVTVLAISAFDKQWNPVDVQVLQFIQRQLLVNLWWQHWFDRWNVNLFEKRVVTKMRCSSTWKKIDRSWVSLVLQNIFVCKILKIPLPNSYKEILFVWI